MSITGDSVFKISRWLGLNENPDGETELKAGEAAEMRNFRITDSGGLQLRPGYRAIAEKAWDGPVRGVWNGMVGERETTVFAAGGSLWELDVKSGAATPILPESETIADDDTRFFGFGGSVYIQNGDGYYVWDGVSAVASVEGYRPLVAVACQPGGGGTALERVNKLNGRRRVRFSPTGSANVFQLPEKSLQSVDFVRNRITNTEYAAADYSINLTNGTVMFASAPAAGTDTIEIGYTYPETMRCEVERMRFAEIFNGSSDNRVFLYGDGTNRTLYSGLDYDGTPRADYFPDLNVLDIGTSNTPITAMIRHYSLLAVFKTDGAFSVAYGTITLAGGAVTAAFYWTPANRSIGNTPPGQAQLVLNAPLTLCDGAVYEWRNASGYAANLTSDERQAKLISKRVVKTLAEMNLAEARTFHDRTRREYYIMEGGRALVYGYFTDAWYLYDPFPLTHLFERDGELYGAGGECGFVRFSRRYQSDGGEKIDACWRSGAMAFGADFRRKHSARVFIVMKPEQRSHITVSAVTDSGGITGGETVSVGLSGFSDADFRHWSFGTNRAPHTRKLRIRTRKFAFYQLLLTSGNDWSTATVLGADVRLRAAGQVR